MAFLFSWNKSCFTSFSTFHPPLLISCSLTFLILSYSSLFVFSSSSPLYSSLSLIFLFSLTPSLFVLSLFLIIFEFFSVIFSYLGWMYLFFQIYFSFCTSCVWFNFFSQIYLYIESFCFLSGLLLHVYYSMGFLFSDIPFFVDEMCSIEVFYLRSTVGCISSFRYTFLLVRDVFVLVFPLIFAFPCLLFDGLEMCWIDAFVSDLLFFSSNILERNHET